MSKKVLILISVAVSLTVICVILVLSVSSAEKLQKMESAAIEKYDTLVRTWSKDGSDTDMDSPDFYSGAYINDDKELVIIVTSLYEAIPEYFSQIIDLEGVVFERVKYTYAELIAERDAISERWQAGMDDPLISSIAAVGISEADNAVNLYIVSKDWNKKRRQAFGEAVRDAVTSFENVNIIFWRGYIEPI